MTTTIGNLPEVVSPEEWLAARRQLLAKEKLHEPLLGRGRIGDVRQLGV